MNDSDNTRLPIGEIARRSGTSVSTIYRIINGTSKTRTGKHQALTRLLQANGHLPESSGARLTILRVTPSTATSHSFEMCRELEEYCHEHDHNLIHCDKERLADTLAGSNVAGVVSFSPLEETPADTPFVLVNTDTLSPEVSAVACDDRLGVVSVFRHFAEMGHRRIGFFDDRGWSISGYSLRRGAGHIPYFYMAAGLEHRPEYVYSADVETGSHPGVICDAVRYFLGLKKRPTAIFLPGDVYAASFYGEIKAAGLRIPEDISVAGFDDMREYLQYLSPGLTTVRKPFKRMIESAMRILMEKARDPATPPERVFIQPELVARESVSKNKRK